MPSSSSACARWWWWWYAPGLGEGPSLEQQPVPISLLRLLLSLLFFYLLLFSVLFFSTCAHLTRFFLSPLPHFFPSFLLLLPSSSTCSFTFLSPSNRRRWRRQRLRRFIISHLLNNSHSTIYDIFFPSFVVVVVVAPLLMSVCPFSLELFLNEK